MDNFQTKELTICERYIERRTPGIVFYAETYFLFNESSNDVAPVCFVKI